MSVLLMHSILFFLRGLVSFDAKRRYLGEPAKIQVFQNVLSYVSNCISK